MMNQNLASADVPAVQSADRVKKRVKRQRSMNRTLSQDRKASIARDIGIENIDMIIAAHDYNIPSPNRSISGSNSVIANQLKVNPLREGSQHRTVSEDKEMNMLRVKKAEYVMNLFIEIDNGSLMSLDIVEGGLQINERLSCGVFFQILKTLNIGVFIYSRFTKDFNKFINERVTTKHTNVHILEKIEHCEIFRDAQPKLLLNASNIHWLKPFEITGLTYQLTKTVYQTYDDWQLFFLVMWLDYLLTAPVTDKIGLKQSLVLHKNDIQKYINNAGANNLPPFYPSRRFLKDFSPLLVQTNISYNNWYNLLRDIYKDLDHDDLKELDSTCENNFTLIKKHIGSKQGKDSSLRILETETLSGRTHVQLRLGKDDFKEFSSNRDTREAMLKTAFSLQESKQTDFDIEQVSKSVSTTLDDYYSIEPLSTMQSTDKQADRPQTNRQKNLTNMSEIIDETNKTKLMKCHSKQENYFKSEAKLLETLD